MPGGETQIVQGRHFDGLLETHLVRGKAFLFAELLEVLLAPFIKLLGRPFAVGQVGEIGAAVRQMRM